MSNKKSEDKTALMMSENCIDFNLRKVTRTVNQFYDSKIRKSGVTVTQHTLLTIIKMTQPITITKLSDIAVMDRTTLARNLKLLEKKCLVKINPGQDRRKRLIGLTEAGQNTLKKSFPLWKNAQTELLDGFGSNNWDDVKKNLSSLIEFLK